MKIDVSITADTLQPEQTQGKIAVVIDVLRATSVICTALSNGALSITPVETTDEALKMRSAKNLIAGERKGFKPQGFDLGNSPLEYTSKIVRDKRIILTTTNGTRAINNSRSAQEIIIACFLNINAVCYYLLAQPLDVCIVCSGTENRFSLDDALCAGNIISLVAKKTNPLHLTDSAFALQTLYNNLSGNLRQALNEGCKHYAYLGSNGFAPDLDYCLQKNILNLVPKLSGNGVVI